MDREMKVSNRNWERLKQWATPFEDSPDDALGKILDEVEARRNVPDSDLRAIPDHLASDDHVSLQTFRSPGKDVALDPENDDIRPEREISMAQESESNNGISEVNRLPRGQRLPQYAYDAPILESLYELGGKADSKTVLAKVERKVKSLLREVDYEVVSNGTQFRWSNTANFSRLALVKRGLLKPVEESGRGTWELTAQGAAEVEKKRG